MRADVFWRTWNRVVGRRRVCYVSVDVDPAADLPGILREALLARGLFPDARSTEVFEVQTDAGIWRHPEGRALGARAIFVPWDVLEAAELRGDDNPWASRRP